LTRKTPLKENVSFVKDGRVLRLADYNYASLKKMEIMENYQSTFLMGKFADYSKTFGYHYIDS